MFCATLLLQLADGFPRLPSEVQQLHLQYKASHSKRGPLLSDLSAVLFSVLKKIKRPFIVIDALDECLERHQESILSIIAQLQCHGARVFATSRPHIECPPSEELSAWHRIEIQAHADDLRRLLSHKIQSQKKNK